MLHSGQLDIYSYRNANAHEIQLVRLFECEELRAYMLVMPPGSRIDAHIHENEHELFDVVDGEGTFEVNGLTFTGKAGKCVFVPAGIKHSLHNTGDRPWTVRLTCQDRLYVRHLGKLIRRAVRKRLT
ncbi:MAG: cupin domain-containing protein [Caldilineaceae bacterium]|nr:cupin domain-containing protein [Caldilineaceae bacterium]